MKRDLTCLSSLLPGLRASGCWCCERILAFHLFWVSQRGICITGFISHFWQVWRGSWRMSVHNSRPLLSPLQNTCLTISFHLGTNKENFLHQLAYLASYHQETLTSRSRLIQVCNTPLAYVSLFPVLFFSKAFCHQLILSIFYFSTVSLTQLQYLQWCKQFGSLFLFLLFFFSLL